MLDRLGGLCYKLAALYLETCNDMLAHNSGAGQKVICNTILWLRSIRRELESSEYLVVISQPACNVPTYNVPDSDERSTS